MTLTAGVISLVSKSDTKASLSATAATGGTSPYTYQWYRSTTTGFSPGGGNIITGATALTLNDSGLVPGTQYYYKVVVTDTGNSNVTATYTQLGVQTSPQSQSQNSFAEGVQVGMLDLPFNYDTIAAQIDSSQVGSLYAGMPVTIVDNAGGVPKVVGISAVTDQVFGYINYDIKTRAFVAGSLCQLSQDGNVMYLYSVGAIARGARVIPSLITQGGVAALVGSGAANIVGFAMDKASAAGQLIRVKLWCPSFLADGS